eukprot:768818-Hanusia_phi.AAC.9
MHTLVSGGASYLVKPSSCLVFSVVENWLVDRICRRSSLTSRLDIAHRPVSVVVLGGDNL